MIGKKVMAKEIKKLADKELKHLFELTEKDIDNVLIAITHYCVKSGNEPKEKKLKDICFKTLEWSDCDSGCRFYTWAL